MKPPPIVVWFVGKTLYECKQDVIFYALRFFRNNKTLTASSLGISVKTINVWVKNNPYLKEFYREKYARGSARKSNNQIESLRKEWSRDNKNKN